MTTGQDRFRMFDNEYEQKANELISRTKSGLKQAIKEVEASYFGNVLASIAKEKLSELENIHLLLNPERPCNIYVVGSSQVGKSSLLNALFKDAKFRTGTGMESCTSSITYSYLENYNVQLYDTIGFEIDKKETCKRITDAMFSKDDINSDIRQRRNVAKNNLPDVILFCYNKSEFHSSRIQALRNTVKNLKDIVAKVKSKTNETVPIIPVLTKLDEGLDSVSKPLSVDDIQMLKDGFEKVRRHSTYRELIESLSTYGSFATAIWRHNNDFSHNYGVNAVMNAVCASADLRASIINNNLSSLNSLRRTLAMKIIFTFVGINTAASVLPLIDIPITTFLINVMVKLLSSLSTDEKRTYEKYSTIHNAFIVSVTFARSAALGLCFLLDLSAIVSFGIGALIGGAVGATASASSTTIIGLHAYSYFCEDYDQRTSELKDRE
jgi:GTPase SAR1 family protein